MSASGGQPQFRYTQPPSKVLHVRNLPWECNDEELIELCKPFGKVLNTKLNVGTNHNQAFVEFADLNQAIAMVSYYASSSEPAQVRGKAVYLQYSTRQEIVTTKQSGDVASNVLLVTIEGVESGDVTIDVLHLVFSAFGFVHKIATFEKSSGFQALVQFGDPTTASNAKSALEGRSIPRYLLPEHVTSCSLRISFSAHNDLNVKFQSHRSRDYTNPYLPVAPSATDASGQKREPESNVLLVSMDNMQYAVTIDVLHTVFSAFGTVQKIAIFEKSAGFQALIQYPDIPTAVSAKEALEGHCIYDGGYCKLHLAFSRHTDLNVKANNERSRDYMNPHLPPVPGVLNNQPGLIARPPGMPPSPAMPSAPAGHAPPAPVSVFGPPGVAGPPGVPGPPPPGIGAPPGSAPPPIHGPPGTAAPHGNMPPPGAGMQFTPAPPGMQQHPHMMNSQGLVSMQGPNRGQIFSQLPASQVYTQGPPANGQSQPPFGGWGYDSNLAPGVKSFGPPMHPPGVAPPMHAYRPPAPASQGPHGHPPFMGAQPQGQLMRMIQPQAMGQPDAGPFPMMGPASMADQQQQQPGSAPLPGGAFSGIDGAPGMQSHAGPRQPYYS